MVTWGYMAMDEDVGDVAMDGDKWPRGQVHGLTYPCHEVSHDQGQHIHTTTMMTLSPSCYHLFPIPPLDVTPASRGVPMSW